MSAEAPAAQAQRRPIVPFLHLGEGPGDKPYLSGYRCGSCGTTYLSRRVACAKCATEGGFQQVKLKDRGKLYVYTIVHQSAPGVATPFISAIVDLDEGVAVRCTLIDVDADPAKLRFDMPVEMVTKTVRTDKEGKEVVAFFFRPLKGA
jgi:hypothetical protein